MFWNLEIKENYKKEQFIHSTSRTVFVKQKEEKKTKPHTKNKIERKGGEKERNNNSLHVGLTFANEKAE